jgi:hypothetical protein
MDISGSFGAKRTHYSRRTGTSMCRVRFPYRGRPRRSEPEISGIECTLERYGIQTSSGGRKRTTGV